MLQFNWAESGFVAPNQPSLADHMKIAGFLLLLAGWAIVLAAIVMLKAAAPRTGFMLAGACVEILGLAAVIRSHLEPRRDRS
jgi:hypothetical protein